MIITVAGTFELNLPAERGIVSLASGAEGPDRRAVIAQATGTTETLRHQLADLKEAGAATWYSVDALTSWSYRPYNKDGLVMPLRYRARSWIQVKFADFGALSAWTTRWAETDGLSIDDVDWALTVKTRAEVTDEVLAGALRNATHRARIVADAAGRPEPILLEAADPGLLQAGQGSGSSYDADQGVEMTRRVMGAGASGESVELSPADIRVASSVQARFEA